MSGYTAKLMTPHEYASGWMKVMVDIWKKRMQEYEVYDSGALQNSFEMVMKNWGENDTGGSIQHSFLQYGIYVERGTGKGISLGNSGDLGFTPVRQPKPWLSTKYRHSIYRLNEYFSEHYGEQFARAIKDTFERSVSLANGI